jgi:hypothetical protein
MKKQIDKKALSRAIVFYSLLAALAITLTVWWIEFIKYFPEIIF